ncbi:SDR family oxidoreductase [Amylibacter sp.]|nr:SDR family oxidoreductase [Amylibacter sp.]
MIGNTQTVLVLGASGMLGNAVLRFFADVDGYMVKGTVRSTSAIQLFPKKFRNLLMLGFDAENPESLVGLIDFVRPDVVINCIGLVKQASNSNDPLVALPINALLPHRLARICANSNVRLIHMSTDCVFMGNKGYYSEQDIADSIDLYGVSKRLGEINYPNTITLRTSIIGHELNGNRSLIDWFLSQENNVKGFSKAIFSGLPTVEIARLIKDYVIPHPELSGVYHVSADPINKYDLLRLVAKIYGKDIEIIKENNFVIDRSLDSSIFRAATGFMPATWPALIISMRDFK